jgi:MtN3 and saliva related transmembrane protein
MLASWMSPSGKPWLRVADLIGYIAAVLTTIAFLPQAIKAFRTRSTKDMSLTMWLLLFTGVCCWLIYGILFRAGPVIAANAVTLVLVGAVLILKLRNG